MEKTVSVVIPFYANANWLCEAVDSVLAQTYGNYEIIVVNDGSKEDVSEFLKKYGDKIKYYEKENGGAASARNEGIKRAEGDYIAFLDSDDLWTPQKLSVQLDAMQRHDARWSITDYEIFGENLQTKRAEVCPADSAALIGNIPPRIATPTVVIERAFLRDNKLSFFEELKYGEDTVLWEQLFSLAPALYIPNPLVRVRIRGDNAGKRAAAQIHGRVEIYDKCREIIPGYSKKHSALYRFAMSLCRFGRIFVNKNSKGKANETIARIMFAIPYVLFKLDRKNVKSLAGRQGSQPAKGVHN